MKNKYIINLLIVNSLIIFLGMMFPYGFSFFSIFLIFILIIKLSNINKLIIPLKFIIFSWLPVFILFLIALLNTDNWNKKFVFDIIDSLTILLLFIFLWSEIKEKEDLEYFEKYFYYSLFILGGIFALLGLLKFLLLINEIKIYFLINNKGIYPWGTSLKSDYNVYSRGLIYSCIAGYSMIFKNKKIIFKWFYLVLLVAIIAAIFLSGSRSSFIITSIFIITEILKILPKLIRKSIKIFKRGAIRKRDVKKTIAGSLILILMIGFLGYKINTTNNYDEINKLQRRIKNLIVLSNDNSSSTAFSSRIQRWKYAIDLYDEFSVAEKISGDGFNYLKNIAVKNESKASIDYPHNLLFSILLSNGILGLIVVVLYLITTFMLTVFLKKDYLFYFFIISIFVSLLSGDQIIGRQSLMFSIMIVYLFFMKMHTLNILAKRARR